MSDIEVQVHVDTEVHLQCELPHRWEERAAFECRGQLLHLPLLPLATEIDPESREAREGRAPLPCRRQHRLQAAASSMYVLPHAAQVQLPGGGRFGHFC